MSLVDSVHIYMLSQHAYNYIHCMYSAMYVSAKPRSVISGLWCVVFLYIPSRVDTVGLSVDCTMSDQLATPLCLMGVVVRSHVLHVARAVGRGACVYVLT